MTTPYKLYCILIMSIVLLSCAKEETCEIVVDQAIKLPSGFGLETREVLEIDLDQDLIPDFEIVSKRVYSPFQSNASFYANTLNSNWTLVGKQSSYHMCSDTTFTMPEYCIEELVQYTEGCDVAGTNAVNMDVHIPIAFEDLASSIMDTVETNSIMLYSYLLFSNTRLINPNKSFYYYNRTTYSYIEDLDKFELLLSDKDGNFATILITKESDTNEEFYIDKVILCR